MYLKLVILTPRNKIIIHPEQNVSDFEIQLARKIRTDVLSLYRKLSSLGASMCSCCGSYHKLMVLGVANSGEPNGSVPQNICSYGISGWLASKRNR